MAKSQLVIVEDDAGVADTLRDYFSAHGYQVVVFERGQDVLDYCQEQLPALVLLDTTLPDLDGYDVCRTLRAATRTSLTPIIFLTEQRDLRHRVAGLEAGADDYVSKPFDVEELALRVKAAIRAHQHFSMTDGQTNMPSGRLIEEQLRNLVRSADWTLLYIGVDNFASFSGEYGFVAGDAALRYVAEVIQEVVDELGTLDDFVGRASNEVFIVITRGEDAQTMAERLRERFAAGIRAHYKPEHVEQGGIKQADGSLVPLMGLSIGLVSDKDGPFYDIIEITRAAAEKRRCDQKSRG